MSGILRKRPPSSGGTPTEPRPSKKQRFVDAAKMLLDIAKESADIFPPLKSCLGGINALIKHYDQCKDVKDKLDDLLPWLEKLLQSLAKVNPNDDPEEAERRSQLARSLEYIAKRSLALSEKGKVARVFDKTQDSQEVISLVEKLRQAVLVYQVSQQQSIYNQVVHLTASFDVILKLHQTSPVKAKIESVRARLDRLRVGGDAVRGANEFGRRKSLFEALEEIKDRLQPLSERTGTDEQAEKEGDVTAVCDLADDLRDAIVEYQLTQQEAIYEQNRMLIDADELSVLNSCRRARGAEFRHGDRQGCLKGTRKAILDEIEMWSRDFDASPIYWLNGLAGTGKSTIAQTIAERLFADGRLGASFFCSRDFEDRRDLHCIFPTLAFQLAHKYPEFRSTAVPLLRSNPDIGHESLFNQMRALIVKPLSLSDISTVIIIDALDECVDIEPQSAILSVMGRLVEEIPNVRFLITGRPEPRIHSGFRLGLLRPLTDVFVLHEVEPSVINADIRLFLEHGLSELAKRSGIGRDVWPTEEHLDLLCERAGGLFVYTVATLRFLDHAFTPPSERLDIIVRAPESTTHEGKALDSLYLSSFQNAFNGMDAEDDEKVRFVIGTVILAVNPLPPSAIATIVGLGKQEVVKLLQLIQSLLKLPEDPDTPVLPFHKSFPDFITDPHRCPDERFYISPRTGHLRLTLECLKLMNDGLERNLLSLPKYALNSEVKDLEAIIKGRISVVLEYACKSWHNHLTEVREGIAATVSALRDFMQERFLAWLEVLSVTGAAKGAVIALERLILWLQEVAKDHELLDITRDYFQFATNFLEVINLSATHIYHSALELSPPSSVVRRFYYSQRPDPSPRVVIGALDSWGPGTVFATPGNLYNLSSTWSPCGRFVATVSNAAVEIRDALTLSTLSTLESSEAGGGYSKELAYSPDGHSLACCFRYALVIWDTQTGGEVRNMERGFGGETSKLVWSLDGTMIGTTFFSPTAPGTGSLIAHVYDVTSGAIRSFGPVQSRIRRSLWAHGKSFRLVTAPGDHDQSTVNIYEVGSALTMVEQFPLPHVIHESSPYAIFSHETYRIFLHSKGEVRVLDVHNSAVLLQETGYFSHVCFSPDGSLLAASRGGKLLTWRYTSSHYTRWREFQHSPTWFQHSLTRFQFSPTPPPILGQTGALLHVLHLYYSPTALTVEPGTTTRSTLVDAYSPHGAYIVTAHHGGSVVTVTGLHSQNHSPSQFIDTGLEISTMVLTGNVLLVEGSVTGTSDPPFSNTVVAWLLTDEGVVDGIFDRRRADRSDGLWDVPFDGDYFEQPISPFGGDHFERPRFLVEGEIAAILWDGGSTRFYQARTGEILNLDTLPGPIFWYPFNNPNMFYSSPFYPDLRKRREPPECNWPVSQTTLQEGWVKDPEGKHRLWLPPRWRSARLEDVGWLCQVTTLRLNNSSGLLVVKF